MWVWGEEHKVLDWVERLYSKELLSLRNEAGENKRLGFLSGGTYLISQIFRHHLTTGGMNWRDRSFYKPVQMTERVPLEKKASLKGGTPWYYTL